MFKHITYKKRLLLLIAFGIIALVLSYLIAFSATINLKHDLNNLDLKLEKLEQAPGQIEMMENKLTVLNDKIGESHVNIPDFQIQMLDKISSYCTQNELILKEFPKAHSWQENNYQFITGYATIEGSFIALLRLLHQLETSYNSGRIASVSFVSKEDRRIKKTRLTMSVYIQTIKQIDNEYTK